MPRRGQIPPDPHQLPLDWDAALRERQQTPPASVDVAVKPLKARSSHKRHTDVVARLPVPRPLPDAVAAGHFGQDEDGKPIRPEADEIRAITESLADRLIELLDAIGEVKQESARQTMQEQFAQGIQMYALEFGDRPAQQLEAYVRRQAALDEDRRGDSKGWRR